MLLQSWIANGGVKFHGIIEYKSRILVNMKFEKVH